MGFLRTGLRGEYRCKNQGKRGNIPKTSCNNAKERAAAMQWDDLKVFLAVARGESLSAAGGS
jgi:hypothetical protein